VVCPSSRSYRRKEETGCAWNSLTNGLQTKYGKSAGDRHYFADVETQLGVISVTQQNAKTQLTKRPDYAISQGLNVVAAPRSTGYCRVIWQTK
jgi:hypothetical protein